MKGIVCKEPGHFEKMELDLPKTEPGMTLLKIRRIGICGTDLHAYKGNQPFFSYPRILGHELAGEIAKVDDDSTLQLGEQVTFIPYFGCGTCVACRNHKSNCCTSIKVCGVHADGGMVEYLAVPTSSIVKSEGLGLDALALVEPLAIGAHGVKRARISPKEYVLVMGAGPIGLGTAELAGVKEANVIVLDTNQNRLDFCKNNLSIPYTINAANEDVTACLMEITGGDMPTVVIDATGNLGAIHNGFQYLAHGGRYVLIGLQKNEISFSHPEFHKREASLMSSRNADREDFEFVIEMIKSGKIKVENYITHRMKFDEVCDKFDGLYEMDNGLIKAMIMV